MSAGNLTGGTLSLKTLYVNGVAVGNAGSGVDSLQGRVGTVTITSTGNTIAVGTSGIDTITLADNLLQNINSTPASPNSTTTALAIPGLTTSSQVLVNLGPGDINNGYILYAVPTAGTLTVTFSTATSNPATQAVIDYWWVNSPT